MSHSIDKELIQDEVIRTTDVLSGREPTELIEKDLDIEENVEDTDLYPDIPIFQIVCLKCGKQIAIQDGFCPHCETISVGDRVRFKGPMFKYSTKPVIGELATVIEMSGHMMQVPSGPKEELITVKFDKHDRNSVMSISRIELVEKKKT